MRPLVAHCLLVSADFTAAGAIASSAHEHLTTAAAMYREMAMVYWPEQAEADLRQLG